MIHNISLDTFAARTTEGYTPLHLAARYNPHSDYESAVGEDIDSDDAQMAQRGYNSYTLSFRRQMSSKEAMEFLITTKEVDVRVFSW